MTGDLFDRLEELKERVSKRDAAIERMDKKLIAELEALEDRLLFADVLSLLNEIRTLKLGDTNTRRVAALRKRVSERIAA